MPRVRWLMEFSHAARPRISCCFEPEAEADRRVFGGKDMGRFWIFIAAVLGALSVAAGAIGAHEVTADASRQAFASAALYHTLHALALLGVGVVLFISQGWRTRVGTIFLNLAALLFVVGIVLFSGGIYARHTEIFATPFGVVPAGGAALIGGWLAFAIGALGLRR